VSTEPTLSIGRAAEAAGVTTRTLRYYEQLGLLRPAARAPGASRRYSEDDLARVERIRRLQDLLGHDLQQIADVLHAEDRLAEIRAAWFEGEDVERRQRLLAEAVAINDKLREQVNSQRAALDAFAAELEDKAERYRREGRRLRAAARKRAGEGEAVVQAAVRPSHSRALSA
jgi:DNA-binding transcriptional MerR regulator